MTPGRRRYLYGKSRNIHAARVADNSAFADAAKHLLLGVLIDSLPKAEELDLEPLLEGALSLEESRFLAKQFDGNPKRLLLNLSAVFVPRSDEDQQVEVIFGVPQIRQDVVAQLEAYQKECLPPNQLRGYRILKELFPLSREEGALVQLLFFRLYSKHLSDFFDANQMSSLQEQGWVLGLTPAQVEYALRPEGLLTRSHLVLPDDPDGPPLRRANRGLHLAQSAEALLIEGRRAAFLKRVGQPDTGPVFPLESFPLHPLDRSALVDLVRGSRPCHILLWGLPGTGKTSLARSLARSVGKTPFLLALGDDGGSEARLFSLGLAPYRLNPRTHLLVIDEADTLLNPPAIPFWGEKAVQKSWLNQYLEECPLQVVWIVNDTEAIHPAVRRRFHFNLEFKSLDPARKENLWRTVLRESRLENSLPEDWVAGLARDFPLSAGSLKAALTVYGRLDKRRLRQPEDRKAALRRLLERQQAFVGEASQPDLAPLSSAYAAELTACRQDLTLVEASVEGFQQARRSEEFAGQLNILCSGAPGTGKTEWVKYLSQRFRLNLKVYRASDLMNPYVGMTEKLIAQMFRAAADPECLVFLDEADTLLSDRQASRHSWEVSRTNELLTHMDQFNGLLVCATNHREALDPAVLRRFAWKLDFEPLGPEALQALLCRQFPHLSFSNDQLKLLETLTGLTPGDIKAVWNRLRFLPHAGSAEVLAALTEECSVKKDHRKIPIGFTGV